MDPFDNYDEEYLYGEDVPIDWLDAADNARALMKYDDYEVDEYDYEYDDDRLL